MKHKPSFRRSAATRADVLAVTAALGLLVPLIVAALQDTGQQARLAQCLSNLGHIGRASNAYLADYQDNLPPVVRDNGFGLGAGEFFYGGKTTSNRWKQIDGGAFWSPVTTRPLNEYVLGGQPQPDVMQGTSVVRRTPMPMFACPSDRGSHAASWDGGTSWSTLTSYDDVGTSYLLNFVAVMYTNVELQEDLWANEGAGWARLLRLLVLDAKAGRADDLLLYMEDPLLYALHWSTGPVQGMGNHGRWSWHAAAYFDGHADYRFMDTRTYCGPGWAVINSSWIKIFGLSKPPVNYINAATNCRPVTE